MNLMASLPEMAYDDAEEDEDQTAANVEDGDGSVMLQVGPCSSVTGRGVSQSSDDCWGLWQLSCTLSMWTNSAEVSRPLLATCSSL